MPVRTESGTIRRSRPCPSRCIVVPQAALLRAYQTGVSRRAKNGGAGTALAYGFALAVPIAAVGIRRANGIAARSKKGHFALRTPPVEA
jgi:hypothetical protein